MALVRKSSTHDLAARVTAGLVPPALLANLPPGVLAGMPPEVLAALPDETRQPGRHRRGGGSETRKLRAPRGTPSSTGSICRPIFCR